VQVGLTTKEQYVHRLGRTARAGKSGSGCLLVTDFELKEMQHELKGLPIQHVQLPSLDSRFSVPLSQHLRRIGGSPDAPLSQSAEKSYQAWLGFYNSHLRKIGWSKAELVRQAGLYAMSIGLLTTPALQKKTIRMMQLTGVPGLRVQG
jgi:ATP-dependent RNA helicase MSS116